MNELKNSLLHFLSEEYGITEEEGEQEFQELQNKKRLQIAYTTLEDEEELALEVYINIREKRLEQVVTGENIQKTEHTEYGTLENMVSDLNNCDFDDFIRLEETNIDDLLQEIH